MSAEDLRQYHSQVMSDAIATQMSRAEGDESPFSLAALKRRFQYTPVVRKATKDAEDEEPAPGG